MEAGSNELNLSVTRPEPPLSVNSNQCWSTVIKSKASGGRGGGPGRPRPQGGGRSGPLETRARVPVGAMTEKKKKSSK